MKDLKKFVCPKKIFPTDYPKDIIKAIKDITNKNYNIRLFGSNVFKNLIYAGDVDLDQSMPINKIEKTMKDIIKNLLKKNYIIGDIKVGIKNEFTDLYYLLGTVHNGVIIGYNPKKIMEIAKLYSIEELYNIPLNYGLTLNKWLMVYDIIHNFLTLRWRPDDILNGYLIQDNNKYLLKDCIYKNWDISMCKIDSYFMYNNRLIEITNVLVPDIKIFNVDEALYNIKINLLTYLLPKKLNIAKALKRAYTITRVSTDILNLNKIAPFLISPVNYTSSLNTDVGVLLDILSVNVIKPYQNIIIMHLNNLLNKMNDFDLFDINKCIDLIKNAINNINDEEYFNDNLKQCKDILLKHINELAKVYINKYEINLNNFIP